MTNGLQASGEWATFLKQQTRLTSLKQTMQVIGRIIALAWRYAWPIPIMVGFAGLLTFGLIHPPADTARSTAHMLALGIAGDCATEAVGGFFSVVGLGLGLVIMRHGLQLQAREEER